MLLVLMVFISANAFAVRGSGDQGYGVMVGNPTGLSAKFWTTNRWAIDGAVGIARSEFDLHATVLYHHYNWVEQTGSFGKIFKGLTARGELPFYFGAGPRLLFEDDKEFGIRLPVGLSFLPHDSRLETFIEIAPVVRFTQDFGFNGDYAIGIRYYFEPIRSRFQQ